MASNDASRDMHRAAFVAPTAVSVVSAAASCSWTPGLCLRHLAGTRARCMRGVQAEVAHVVRSQLSSPGTQIGRPKTSIKKDVGRVTREPEQPQADAEKGSAKARPRRKTQADEVPMFKVILLGDESYEETHVVTQLQKTCQLEKGDASRVYMEAQSTGSAIICVVCEEHAEFYAQQLRRQEIFVVVEKDDE